MTKLKAMALAVASLVVTTSAIGADKGLVENVEKPKSGANVSLQCIGGYEFAVVVASDGHLALQQIYGNGTGAIQTTVPRPIECDSSKKTNLAN